ncbi:hypothetical protein O6H91_09G065500 [Diphasiastrum complanatum]|uniref:Uncharacterized protein n=8 Tax=Diphasiastrum complanatum TaxID=34168 RepID=A0ACC2CQI5_DIPCM|nr:hypothetical protein O6H91_09G065500 [Diphasiastrum complanatum]KAJ7544129.1 hypothetical protein O6H91_09G065500 [Diphasiastrum complanatum]KAJ7544130.1 hypothetical protein O6H91_09G065500 [Diphasiastrum complanatum]KAJ7544131.1 hypothetical protein O6H91_09G065500 [Diphasiastrum complanatum]KAJ7544132.1 hypothetical protein O6H91_09G065500 [Diphasiastrum complanatum]
MIGSFLTRGIIMLLGYMYPAYECFKAVEKNRPDIQQLRFWCQYWMIIAIITVVERVADVFISWVPMYCEAKLAFIIYLWYPKTKGTSYIYCSFLKPFLLSRETEIDQRLSEFKITAGDMAYSYWKLSSVFIQAKVLEFLQFVASQSSRPHQTQRPSQPPRPPASATVSEPPVPPSGYSAPLSSQYPQPTPAYTANRPTGYSAPASSQHSQPVPPSSTGVYRPEYRAPQSGYPGAVLNHSLSPSAPIYPAPGSFPPNYPAPLTDYTASAPPTEAPPGFYRPPLPNFQEEEEIGYDSANEQTEPRSTYPTLQRPDNEPVSAVYMTRSRRRATTYARS